MDLSTPLAKLVQRLHESNARFETIRHKLPGPLRSNVRPGPLDEEGWSLLASNAAVAAKLKYLVPLLAEELARQGWPAVALRVKVLSRQG